MSQYGETPTTDRRRARGGHSERARQEALPARGDHFGRDLRGRWGFRGEGLENGLLIGAQDEEAKSFDLDGLVSIVLQQHARGHQIAGSENPGMQVAKVHAKSAWCRFAEGDDRVRRRAHRRCDGVQKERPENGRATE